MIDAGAKGWAGRSSPARSPRELQGGDIACIEDLVVNRDLSDFDFEREEGAAAIRGDGLWDTCGVE